MKRIKCLPISTKKCVSYYFSLKNKFQKNGEFTWSDNWAVRFVQWGENQPSEPAIGMGCVAINNVNGNWYDSYCSTKLPFICKTTDGEFIYLMNVQIITKTSEIMTSAPFLPFKYRNCIQNTVSHIYTAQTSQYQALTYWPLIIVNI